MAVLPDDSQHMQLVRCPHGHEHYVDKRVVCQSSGTGLRGELDSVIVKCPICKDEFEADIDCNPYRIR